MTGTTNAGPGTPGTSEMKRSLSLTGVTVNAMALIAPGAFLWTTFQEQAAQTAGTTSTATEMWTGLVFSLILALLTAYSYSELARIYPEAGAGSSYYFAEAALLSKPNPRHQRYSRLAKLTIGWISHLYYWIYPGIMVAFTATLFGYIYQTLSGHAMSYPALAGVCVVFAGLAGYIAYRGVSGSTNTAIVINVIQITSLVLFSVAAIVFRLTHATHTPGAYTQPISHVVIPHDFLDLIYQSTIAILLLVGFESVTALGAEARNPGRDIRRGVLLSLIIQGGICYLFEYFSANLVIGHATLTYRQAAASSAPIGSEITTIGNKMLGGTGETLALIMAATVLLALIGTTLACLNTGVRITYAMSRDKEMPSILGFLHGKYATPHGGIAVLTVVSALLGIYGAQPAQTDNLTQITLASNTGTFLVYGMTCLVTLVAFASRGDKSTLKHYVVPGLGLFMNAAELCGVVYLAVTAGGSGSADAYKALAIVGAWILAGVIWVAVNPRMRGVRVLSEPQVSTRQPVEV